MRKKAKARKKVLNESNASNKPNRVNNLSDNDRHELFIKLRLINDAQERGATWADIAKALGYSDAKAAKNDIKNSAKRLERLLRSEAQKREV